MKTLVLLLGIGLALTGCSGSEVVNVPQKGRVERKEYKDMTKEEKIEFINRTPMPPDAKQRAIDGINAGKG